MRLRNASGVLVAAGMLALLVWVSVQAQSPRSPAPTGQPAPMPTLTRTPPTRFAPTSNSPSSGAFPVQTADAINPYASNREFTIPSPDAPSLSMLPVKLQLASGLALEGNVEASGPFPC